MSQPYLGTSKLPRPGMLQQPKQSKANRPHFHHQNGDTRQFVRPARFHLVQNVLLCVKTFIGETFAVQYILKFGINLPKAHLLRHVLHISGLHANAQNGLTLGNNLTEIKQLELHFKGAKEPINLSSRWRVPTFLRSSG